MKDTTRKKLDITKMRIDNHSDHSEDYVSLYNRSFHKKYNWIQSLKSCILHIMKCVFFQWR